LAKKFTIKSEFVRNVLTLTSGTALAQLIPLILAPFLSRIYDPEDFGRLALYLAIVQILGAISSGRYELAIMLPKKEKEGVQITLLSIVITIAVSLVSLIVVLFFSDASRILQKPIFLNLLEVIAPNFYSVLQNIQEAGLSLGR